MSSNYPVLALTRLVSAFNRTVHTQDFITRVSPAMTNWNGRIEGIPAAMPHLPTAEAANGFLVYLMRSTQGLVNGNPDIIDILEDIKDYISVGNPLDQSQPKEKPAMTDKTPKSSAISAPAILLFKTLAERLDKLADTSAALMGKIAPSNPPARTGLLIINDYLVGYSRALVDIAGIIEGKDGDKPEASAYAMGALAAMADGLETTAKMMAYVMALAPEAAGDPAPAPKEG